MGQKIIVGEGAVIQLEGVLRELCCSRLFLVCDTSYPFLNIRDKIDRLPFEHVVFNGFTSNPLYEDVKRGVELFRNECCDTILAVGGGSTIDVAKCIKLYCKMSVEQNYLTQEYRDTGVPLIAIPTTAGTGSESTRYAVIYFEGKKQSVTHDSIVPGCVILDPSVLKTLPMYQKKCTMLDALCQGIESWWSVNATEKSKEYSARSVRMIVENMNAYLNGSDEAAEQIMLAANISGRAINITQTTAPHAMSYKLTSLYGLPHGHAVAICLPAVWRAMLVRSDNCKDGRNITDVFSDIARELGAQNSLDAIERLEKMLSELGIKAPNISSSELDILAASVNPVRLKNNPVNFTERELYDIYAQIASKR